ncbi:phage tail protein [Clostridium botulinum]|uniref:phage tail protein n=2 Tax=Clostridium botulinum TaxID=1491 RepID=UPI001E4D187E|nr:phage tail protein [Clostridium botulinum]MCD3202816.1 phage tail protein [Clostridium botulinum C/D]MCD3230896.1 phage tail protein [Clostridium botulinum C/D]MCD3253918.1 phage tail protein [Clostridium botulinum C/D]MCD3279486.1 phage tail protein [Clostridium botulinum C/D]MCD3281621.1 phage tail protein [Clostridium botulinum C/D]
MSEQFYTILTSIGKAKIANASALGKKLNLIKFQLGDGGGSYYNPTEEQIELKNKVWEGNINSISVDENNPNWIVIQAIIPSDIGGFMIREAAILDDEENLIAIGKYPETYKPVASNGSTKDLTINMILEISNLSNITLKVDPSVIIATQKDIKSLEKKLGDIKIPVTSVNSKTGAIELKAKDIKAEDGTNLEKFKEDINSQYEDLTKQLNNFGSRNYLLNVSEINTWESPRSSKEIIKDTNFNKDVLKITLKDTSELPCGTYISTKNILNDLIKNNEIYTWSVWLRADEPIRLLVGHERNGRKEITVSTQWEKYTHTYTVKENNGWKALTFYILDKNRNKTSFYISEPKLEQGTTVTDWSIAPEEIIANSKRLDVIEQVLIEKGFNIAKNKLN